MPKTNSSFDPNAYAPVAERITAFYAVYPKGRIVTDLIARQEGEIVFRARVYRCAEDARPAATGWACERKGDGDVNEVACLENTETSAIGRALANLGFSASRLRPSAEEMLKVARARANNERRSHESRVHADIGALIRRAERAGVRPLRASRWRSTLRSNRLSIEEFTALESRLRRWVRRHEMASGRQRSGSRS